MIIVYKNTKEMVCLPEQEGAISTLSGKALKSVDQFPYLSSIISFTENDLNICLTNAWTAVDKLSIIWKSDLFDKIKRDFFQADAPHGL